MHKYFWLSALVLLLDQITKVYIDYNFELHQSLEVMPFFNLTLAYNYGAAFSFLADESGWQKWFLLILTSAISIFIARWLLNLESHEKYTAIALALILGGALGNILDRALYGYVIDFLDVYVGQYHWPTFNVADSAIAIGAFFILYDIFFRQEVNRQ